ncbi:hypothetical protein, partial [uncultured Nocardioides sp.]|uniref:hypothetical protein n=1 Tax=uncultured Nocardioides sp. TaxID=198441 RepID=UPI00261A02F5
MSQPSLARRAVHGVVVVSTAAALSLAAPTTTASAAPLPATYTGDAHGDVVRLRSALGGAGLADLFVGHSRTTVDSRTAPAVRATSTNVEAGLGGGSVSADSTTATAPPSMNPDLRRLAAVNLSPVATAGVVEGDVAASYENAEQCVAGVNGLRQLGTSRTTLAGLNLINVLGVRALAVKASETTTSTALEDQPDGSSRMVSTATTSVGDVDVLGGSRTLGGVTIEVVRPVSLTATSDGTTGKLTSQSSVVRVRRANGTVTTIEADGRPVSIGLNLPGATVALTVAAFDDADTSTGALGRGSLDAVVAVDLEISTVLSGPLVDVSLDLGRLTAQALAPAGGVECDPGAQDPDNDGLTNDEEAELGTDPDDADSDDDGLTDGREVDQTRTDPLDPDSDDGGVDDGTEVGRGTDPNNAADDIPVVDADRDDDGLSNDEEAGLGTDPDDADSDDDGLNDGTEVELGTDPLDPDTDDGGVLDGPEVDRGTDPLVAGDDFPVVDSDRDDDGLTNDEEAGLGTDPDDADSDDDGLNDGT